VGAARAIVDGIPYDDISRLRGIGQWTVGYVELRGLGKLDSVPIGDAGLRSSLAEALGRCKERLKPVDVASIMERYAPYRSFATAHLWAMLADADR
jgi:3-methyladenine DNA glycosylase/8-oxoguanine DNA glycosylase